MTISSSTQRSSRVEQVENIDHPIFREVLSAHPIGPSIEIVSLADIPAGTGLDPRARLPSVCCVRSTLSGEHVTAGALAEEACTIEIDRLRRPVGKQDQYIAAFGGLTCFIFEPDGKVRVQPLMIPTETLYDLEAHLVMFFTGYSRDAASILADQRRRSDAGDTDMLDNLKFIKELGFEIVKRSKGADPMRFAELMDTHWQHKKRRSAGMSDDRINTLYDVAIANGAVGGKLVGAGAGGFLLLRQRPGSGPRARWQVKASPKSISALITTARL